MSSEAMESERPVAFDGWVNLSQENEGEAVERCDY